MARVATVLVPAAAVDAADAAGAAASPAAPFGREPPSRPMNCHSTTTATSSPAAMPAAIKPRRGAGAIGNDSARAAGP